MLLSWERINASNLFLKLEIDSEFLIFSSKLDQSLNVEGKKKVLETIYSKMHDWCMAVSCSYSLISFWN